MRWPILAIVIFAHPYLFAQERGPKDGWSTGLFTLYRSQPYKGLKSETRAFPLISYRSGGFFIRGPFIGYDLRASEVLNITTSLIPNLFGGPFDPSESSKLKDMDERDGSIEAAIQLRLKLKFINLNLGHRRDLLGVYNGANTSFAIGTGMPISVFFKSLPFTLLRFSVGKRFIDANENFYLYGVGEDDVSNTREYYNPGEVTNDFYTFFFLMKLSENWNLTINYQKEFLHPDIQKSPIINEGIVERAFLSLAYTF